MVILNEIGFPTFISFLKGKMKCGWNRNFDQRPNLLAQKHLFFCREPEEMQSFRQTAEIDCLSGYNLKINNKKTETINLSIAAYKEGLSGDYHSISSSQT